MSDTPETPAEQAEARAIRRRWVTLGEVVAVAGLVIGGLTLWNSWDERRTENSEKSAEASLAKAAAARLDLKVTVEDGKLVNLTDPQHELLDVQVAFPAALKVDARSPVLPTIEADWFTPQMLRATDGGPDEREGVLPVLVRASYRVEDATRTETAIVDVLWRTSGRVLAGRSLKIIGARIRQRGGDQARLDALWTKA